MASSLIKFKQEQLFNESNLALLKEKYITGLESALDLICRKSFDLQDCDIKALFTHKQFKELVHILYWIDRTHWCDSNSNKDKFNKKYLLILLQSNDITKIYNAINFLLEKRKELGLEMGYPANWHYKINSSLICYLIDNSTEADSLAKDVIYPCMKKKVDEKGIRIWDDPYKEFNEIEIKVWRE